MIEVLASNERHADTGFPARISKQESTYRIVKVKYQQRHRSKRNAELRIETTLLRKHSCKDYLNLSTLPPETLELHDARNSEMLTGAKNTGKCNSIFKHPIFIVVHHHYENSTRLPPNLACFACALSALRRLLLES
jgi:hypothetical protein